MNGLRELEHCTLSIYLELLSTHLRIDFETAQRTDPQAYSRVCDDEGLKKGQRVCQGSTQAAVAVPMTGA